MNYEIFELAIKIDHKINKIENEIENLEQAYEHAKWMCKTNKTINILGIEVESEKVLSILPTIKEHKTLMEKLKKEFHEL